MKANGWNIYEVITQRLKPESNLLKGASFRIFIGDGHR